MIEASFQGRFGAFALEAAFTAPGQGVTAIFGPSGCGKTTILRAIAGLGRLEGTLRVGGEVWQGPGAFRPPHRRPIGYVFQEPSLFPHLSVRRNLDYGRRRAGPGPVAFDETVALLGLEPLLSRAPAALSGGERQRVAIGRALLSQPRLLLMDEPLAALDRGARGEILPYLERLRDALALPVLYVSHDIAEVERLAAHLVLMERGRVVAQGALSDIAADPRLPLARAPEAGVTVLAEVLSHDPAHDIARLAIPGAELLVPGLAVPPGQPARLRIAAADVSLTRQRPEESSILNILPARIFAAEPDGSAMVLALDLGGTRILARITRLSMDRLGLAPGQAVFAQVKGVTLAR